MEESRSKTLNGSMPGQLHAGSPEGADFGTRQTRAATRLVGGAGGEWGPSMERS